MKLARLPRIVLSDLDGTLLSPSHDLSPRTRSAVRALTARGIRFAIATGRMTGGTDWLVRELDIPCSRICLDGALVLDEHDRIVYSNTLRAEDALGVLQQTSQRWPDLTPSYFSGTHWYANDIHAPAIEWESQIVGATPEQANLLELIGARVLPNKIFFSRTIGAERSIEVANTLHDLFPQLNIIRSSNGTMIELINAEVNKALGARKLLKSLDIPLAEALAFGDEENDRPLLEVAGYSVAVANAPLDVQRIANEVCPRNAEDGVAQYLERMLKQFPASGAIV